MMNVNPTASPQVTASALSEQRTFLPDAEQRLTSSHGNLAHADINQPAGQPAHRTAGQQPLTAQDVPLEKLKGSKLLTEAEKVAELSRQFEAVFLRQILGQARKVLVQSKFESESATSGLYNDMVTSQLADSISKSGDFGLASSLQAQLHRQLLKTPATSDEKSLPTSPSSLLPRPSRTDHKPAEFFLPSSIRQ